MIERTLVLVKPDGVSRALVGEVISRFEKRGLKIIGMKMIWPDKEFAMKHYTDDISKRHGEHIRELLLNFIVQSPVVSFVIEGVNAVEVVRKIAGSTYPSDAPLGTIRGDYAHVSKGYADDKKVAVANIVHASGSLEEAKLEVDLWFSDSELFEYELANEKHMR